MHAALPLAQFLALAIALALAPLGFDAAALPASPPTSTLGDTDAIIAQVALAARDPASWRRRSEEELLTYLSPNDLCYRRPSGSGLHSALRREFR